MNIQDVKTGILKAIGVPVDNCYHAEIVMEVDGPIRVNAGYHVVNAERSGLDSLEKVQKKITIEIAE